MPYRQKHTWIFGGGQKGWSEAYYIQDLTPTIAAGQAIAAQVATLRAQMLGTGLYIKGVRIQEVEAADGSKVKFVGDTFQSPRYNGSSTQPAAQADLSLLIDNVSQAPLRHRNGYLGGFWDIISQNFGTYTPDPGFTLAFNAWKAKILEFGYGWVQRVPSVDFALTNYVVSAEQFVTLTCAGTPFAGLGDTPFLVNIKSLPAVGGMSVLNGNHMVVRVTDATARILKRWAVSPFVAPGFLQKFTYTFKEVFDLNIEKVVSRERGAPLLESRGRRRALRRT